MNLFRKILDTICGDKESEYQRGCRHAGDFLSHAPDEGAIRQYLDSAREDRDFSEDRNYSRGVIDTLARSRYATRAQA